jgi:hypothetical protein
MKEREKGLAKEQLEWVASRGIGKRVSCEHVAGGNGRETGE